MPGRSPEVLILGGGPAGCAAAIVLATCGHDVRVVTRPVADERPLPESIPPSTVKLFDLLGVRAAIDRAGFVRSSGNTVWWGAGPARVEAFANGGLGWQVTSDRLQPILQQAAVSTGARVVSGRLDVQQASDLGAQITLDCTGRSGVLARARGLRRAASAHKTVALVGLWQPDEPLPLADPTHTWIESYEAGWAWSVPAIEARRFVAVMVDPRTSDLVHDQSAKRVYLAELQRTRVFDSVLRQCTLLAGPTGWDASMYDADRYVDGRLLLVGDAGSFIDPLSSIGVKKALASGWLAGVATHTALVQPAMAAVAFDFYAAREAEVYSVLHALTTGYVAEAATSHQHVFWNDRVDELSTRGAVDQSKVQAALDRIRASSSLAFRRAPSLRVEDRPAVSGWEIVLEKRLVTDEEQTGVRYVHDVDLLALLDLAPSHDQVPDLFDAYNRAHAPVSLPGFLTALATVVAREWLVIIVD